MRTATTFTASLLIASLLVPTVALAGNPHFIANQTFAVLDGEDLVVEFKEAGLPSGSIETITVSGTFNVTLQCINNGQKNPKDPKKTLVTTDVSTSGEFEADKSGNIVGNLTLEAPEVEFSCPPGQTVVSSNESWTGVRVTDADTGASRSLGNFIIG